MLGASHMKPHRRLTLTLALLAVAAPHLAGAAPITIDFEDLNDGAAVGTHFTGLTFTDGTILASGISLNEFEYPVRSGSHVVSRDAGGISIRFAVPVARFTGYFTYSAALTLQAFNSSNTPIGSVSSKFGRNLALSGDPESSPNELLQLADPSGIAEVRITGAGNGDAFTLDDVSIEPLVHGLMSVTPSSLRFGAGKTPWSATGTTVTPAQNVTVTFAGAASAWTANANQSWAQITNGSGSGGGRFTVSISNPDKVLGTSTNVTATITVIAPDASNSPLSVPVTLTVAPADAPFGAFDTPANGSTGVVGAIPVTGWSLDDIGVIEVQIWRNCVEAIDRPAGACTQAKPGGPRNFVFIGNGAFLAGARPDVETLNPTIPQGSRAGWGYLMSTNALPHLTNGTAHGGQGTFTLSAYAVDGEAHSEVIARTNTIIDGHYTLLGQKTITLDNDHAAIPFGSIDTPDQGGTVTVPIYANFGWAMTQSGKCIDTTTTASYKVYIDGVSLPLTRGTNWFPGLNRPDIAAAYPGLCNTNDALAAYYIDTNALGLVNGLHTTGWDVIDNQGQVAGIGSRFFNVLVGSGAAPDAFVESGLPGASASEGSWIVSGRPVVLSRTSDLGALALAVRSVRVRVGPDGAPFETVAPDSGGSYAVQFPAGSRIALDLGGPVEAGYQIVGDELRALPAGSTFAAAHGQFAWQPPVPFLGPFHLVFTSGGERLDVLTRITDPTAASAIEMHIDTPAADATAGGSFVVAGWALDPLATTGSGIDTLHVWAYRRDAIAVPQILGAAAVGGVRPDVAAIYGAQFEASGFTLTVPALAPGVYDLLVYPWSHRTGQFGQAMSVRLIVR